MKKLDYSGWELGSALRWRNPRGDETEKVLQQRWHPIGEQEVPYIYLDVPDESGYVDTSKLKSAVEEVKSEIASRQT